jgi:hypothetical protein
MRIVGMRVTVMGKNNIVYAHDDLVPEEEHDHLNPFAMT